MEAADVPSMSATMEGAFVPSHAHHSEPAPLPPLPTKCSLDLKRINQLGVYPVVPDSESATVGELVPSYVMISRPSAAVFAAKYSFPPHTSMYDGFEEVAPA